MNLFDIESAVNRYSVSIFLFIIAAIFLLARLKISRKRSIHTRKSNAYVNALNELIAGNNDQAIELFKEAVRYDTNNIDAYIKLGMLWRIQNSTQKALKIHKELIIRKGLSHGQLTEIYKNIISDQIDLEQYDEALNYCKTMLEHDKENRWVLEIEPKIFEYKKDFKNAFKHLKANVPKSAEVDHKLALYKIAYGKNLMNKGEFRDARMIFKEAIKYDREYPASYLYLGDAYAREDRQDDAVKVWKQFAETVPKKSYLVFNYLDAAFFESGNYSAIEDFYSDIIEKDPDNYRALLRIGEIYFKKGERDKALDMAERSIKINPSSADGLKNLIFYLNNSEDIQVIKEKALSLANMITDSETYLCKFCHYTTTDILIQCPSCNHWDAFDF